jgi:hypothetical protein
VNVDVFDGRNPVDLDRLAEDPYLGHFKPPARLLIVRGSSIPWSSAIDGLASAAAHSGDWSYVYYSPWWPGNKRRAREFLTAFPDAATFARELLVVAPTTKAFPVSALALRQGLGGSISGSWLIGSTSDRNAVEAMIRSPDARVDPVSYTAERLSSVSAFCLAFDEGDLSTLFLRLTEATGADADRIKTRVLTLGPSEVNPNRETYIGATFVIAAIIGAVGVLASDLRILAIIGVPIAGVCWLLSRSKLAILVSICGLAAMRFLFTALVTHDLTMVAGCVVASAATIGLLRFAEIGNHNRRQ